MKQCPHANGRYGCNALLNNGFAQNALVVPENWSKLYCNGANYHQCPNLKAAFSMKQEKRKSTGAKLVANEKPVLTKKVNSKQDPKKSNAVHAHGGKAPHYCEKPWRSADLRFRVTVSDFYSRPWS